MDLKQQLLEDHPDSLVLTGYGPFLRWILRNPNAGNAGEPAFCYSPCWPFAKVTFREAADFEDPDWEWLLRYHGLEGIRKCAFRRSSESTHSSRITDTLFPGIPDQL